MREDIGYGGSLHERTTLASELERKDININAKRERVLILWTIGKDSAEFLYSFFASTPQQERSKLTIRMALQKILESPSLNCKLPTCTITRAVLDNMQYTA